MTEELKDAFIHNVYGSRKKSARDCAARCAEMLLMIQEYGTILYKRPSDQSFPGALGEIYENFTATYNGVIKESTLTSYRTYLKVSANYLSEQKVADVNDITPDIIVNFTMTLSRFSGCFAKDVMRLFSKFLHYAYECGLSAEDKSQYCMKVRFYDGEKIPPTFTTDEIEKILSVIAI
jgi:site-specific recombinase XerC